MTAITIATAPANRKEIAEAFGQNQSAVRRIEGLTRDVTVNLPDAIDAGSALAEQALALAQALQQVAYVIAGASGEVPNASVLLPGTGLSLLLGPGTITLSLSIPVTVQNGGTGLSALPSHAVPIGNGVGAPNFAAPGTAGQVLMSNGAAADPSFQATVTSILAGAGISISGATGNVTVGLTPPVAITLGGTGANTAASALANLGGVPSTSVGAVNGVASLDSTGKVPTSQLPASVLGAMNYQGTWNASTNVPTLVSGVGTKGFFYKVSVAGTTNIDGNSSWNVGDMIAFDGTTWDKFDGDSTVVTSVNGQIGAVTITASGIGALTASNNLSDLTNSATARTNLGLGSMATQSAAAVSISGGSITGTSISGASGSFTTLQTSGNAGLGGAPSGTAGLVNSLPVTGGTSAQGINNSPTIQSGVTTSASINYSSPSTVAASFTLTEINHYDATFGTLGSGSVVTNQYGFRARPTLVGATNNYGFRGQIPSGTGHWNLYMDGTANNYVAGNLQIGSATATAGAENLQIGGSLSISSATMIRTYTSFTNGAGSAAGTLNNAPAAGNPTKWIPINDNGTTRYIPAW